MSSREIKFRFWDSRRNRFENGSGYIFSDTGFNHLYITPIQYINLKDKNGVEVYEGYVIKAGSNGRLRVVHHGYGSNVSTGLEIDEVIFNEYLYSHEIEVVGNIYENPELIGEMI